jgi:nicotinamidase-related amidase
MCSAIEPTRQVLDEYIKPCLDTAREAGMTVFHVEPDLIANKYPISNLEWKPTDIPPYPEKWGNLPEDQDAEEPQSVAPVEETEATWKDAIPGWSKERAEMVHGPGYRDWEGYQQMDVVESCKPIEGEYVIKTTQQFDRICRRVGVVNLIYVGFSTQGCIQFSPGGIAETSARGYRVMIIREATLGVEWPDTMQQCLVTQLAIRNIEHKFGFSIGAEDFIHACKVVAEGR